MTRSFTPEEVRKMPLSEAFRVRAELRQQLRRGAWRGESGASRQRGGELLLALDARIGSDESRLQGAARDLYGAKEAGQRFGGGER
jgi:murein DD-endopeptidase MepM/ murein hydrolase activator NlpD